MIGGSRISLAHSFSSGHGWTRLRALRLQYVNRVEGSHCYLSDSFPVLCVWKSRSIKSLIETSFQDGGGWPSHVTFIMFNNCNYLNFNLKQRLW